MKVLCNPIEMNKLMSVVSDPLNMDNEYNVHRGSLFSPFLFDPICA